jgi:hypothetical protein
MHIGTGKTQGGVGILGGTVLGPGVEQGELVYEQPGTEVDDSCHS